MSKKSTKKERKEDPILDSLLGADVPDEGEEKEERETPHVVREGQEKETEEVEQAEIQEEVEAKAPEKTDEVPDEEEPSEEEERLKAEEKQKEHEKALREALTAERAKNRELREQMARYQAPAPIQPDMHPGVTPAMPSRAPIPTDRLEVKINDDGTAYLDENDLERFIAPRVEARVSQATRADPEQQFRSALEEEKRRWVGIDEFAPARSHFATRMQQAVEFLEILSDNHVRTHRKQYGSISELINEMRQEGAEEQFKTLFPEIEDLDDFVDAMFIPGPIPDRVQRISRYIKRNFKGLPDQSSAVQPVVGALPQQLGQSNVLPLAKQPRSMAKKGTGTPAKTKEEARFQELSEKAATNPMGMTKNEWDELKGFHRARERESA